MTTRIVFSGSSDRSTRSMTLAAMMSRVREKMLIRSSLQVGSGSGGGRGIGGAQGPRPPLPGSGHGLNRSLRLAGGRDGRADGGADEGDREQHGAGRADDGAGEIRNGGHRRYSLRACSKLVPTGKTRGVPNGFFRGFPPDSGEIGLSRWPPVPPLVGGFHQLLAMLQISAPTALLAVRPRRLHELGAGEKGRAGAGQRQQPAAEARIELAIVRAPLDRAERQRVDDEHRLEARLDREQPANPAEHGRRKARDGPVAEFRDFRGSGLNDL